MQSCQAQTKLLPTSGRSSRQLRGGVTCSIPKCDTILPPPSTDVFHVRILTAARPSTLRPVCASTTTPIRARGHSRVRTLAAGRPTQVLAAYASTAVPRQVRSRSSANILAAARPLVDLATCATTVAPTRARSRLNASTPAVVSIVFSRSSSLRIYRHYYKRKDDS